MTVYCNKITYAKLMVTASEELAVLDTDYIENKAGVDGQLTFVHVDSGQTFSIIMGLVDNQDGISNNYFEGLRAVSDMPLGDYQICGRVVDKGRNYLILSDFDSPNGEEDIQEVLFELVQYEEMGKTITAIVWSENVTAELKSLTFNAKVWSESIEAVVEDDDMEGVVHSEGVEINVVAG